MNESPNTDVPGKGSLIRRRINSWKSETPRALIFDPSLPEVVTEEDIDKVKKETNDLEIQLPRWRNRVHIYEDSEKKGYIFTLRLDRLGFIKNCKRRLGYSYKVLHVKADKPCEI